MTTYLGEKAVGIGTVKATMSVGKVITDDKTILGDGFTEPLAVNTLLFATSESVAASAEAVRTEFDGKLKAVEGEITNVEDDVRELRKGTHDELVDIKLDVSDLKDADQNIRTEMAGLQTQVTAQIAGKQDKLTAGENITIEDGVISATGGGTGGDYLPLSGGTITGEVAFNAFNLSDSHTPILRQMSTGELAVSVKVSSGIYADICKFNVAGGYVLPGSQYTELGSQYSRWGNVYVTKLNNGADIAIPATGGTMALKEDIDAAVGDISTALTAILGE